MVFWPNATVTENVQASPFPEPVHSGVPSVVLKTCGFPALTIATTESVPGEMKPGRLPCEAELRGGIWSKSFTWGAPFGSAGEPEVPGNVMAFCGAPEHPASSAKAPSAEIIRWSFKVQSLQ